MTDNSETTTLQVPNLETFYLMFDHYRQDYEAMGHDTNWWYKGRGPTRQAAVAELNSNIQQGITLSRTTPVIWSKEKTNKIIRGKTSFQDQVDELKGLLDL
jgi:hypothetical protein